MERHELSKKLLFNSHFDWYPNSQLPTDAKYCNAIPNESFDE